MRQRSDRNNCFSEGTLKPPQLVYLYNIVLKSVEYFHYHVVAYAGTLNTLYTLYFTLYSLRFTLFFTLYLLLYLN